MAANTLEQVYDFIAGEDDEGSACDALPADACTNIPHNFFLNAANGAITKLGDQLASPSLVLPWLLDALGAPAFLTGWLVPVRRAGALLPQLVIAGRMREYEVRKWWWAAGGAVFGLAFLLMVPAALLLPSLAAGVAIIFALALGSLGRGVSSVAFKDVLAKTVPEGSRGSLLATRATLGGILTLAAAIVLRLRVADQTAVTPYVWLVGIGGVLWLAGAALVTLIAEEPGATGGSRNALEEARAGWHLLREQPGFRRFILARALLLSVNLAVPFYVLYAKELTGGTVSGLSAFVIATALAQIVSSPLWGRFSDRSSRTVMLIGSGLAIVSGIVTLLLGVVPDRWQTTLLFAASIFFLGIARAGVRLGRKTYLVDAMPAEERPLYAAVASTVIGIITLASGALGVIASLTSVPVLLVTFLIITGAGAYVAWRMPEADAMLAD